MISLPRGQNNLPFNSSEKHFNKVNASESTDMNLDTDQICSAEDTLAVNTVLLMLSQVKTLKVLLSV